MECNICSIEILRNETEYHKIGVCSNCADYIYNWYSKEHSGLFATWDNGKTYSAKSITRKKIGPAKRLRIFQRDNFSCKICGVHGGDLTIDHILPVSKGGDNDDENLQTCCRKCNLRKGNRHE